MAQTSSRAPPTAGSWRSPASATCTPRPTCTPTRSAATSRARPTGSARPPPRCTRALAGGAAHRGPRGRGRATLAEAMRSRLDRAAAEVPALVPYVEALRAAFADVAALDDPLEVQRVHGDYHLGQVMRTLDGWKLLDFEGEPARPLAERRALESPVKDVAGMLRLLRLRGPAPARRPPADPQREYRAARVGARNRDAFCAGYTRAGGPDPREAAGAAARVRDRQGGLRGPLRGPQPAHLVADPHGGDPQARRDRGVSERMSSTRPPGRPRPGQRSRSDRPRDPARRRRGAAPPRLRRAPRPARGPRRRTRTTAESRSARCGRGRPRRRSSSATRATRCGTRAMASGWRCCPRRRCRTTAWRSPTTAGPGWSTTRTGSCRRWARSTCT